MLRRMKMTAILLLGLLAVMILLPTAYADGNGGTSEPPSISAVFRQANPQAGAQIDLDWSVTGGTAPYSVQAEWIIQESCLQKIMQTDSASGGAGVFSYNVPGYADQLWAFVTVTDSAGAACTTDCYTELANYKHADAASFSVSNDVGYAYVGETVSASWRINAGRHTISSVRYKWVLQTSSESKDLTGWTGAGNSLTGTAAYTTAEKGSVYLNVAFDAEDGWYCPGGIFDPIQVLNQGEVPLTAEIRISPDNPNPGDTLTIEWNVTGAGANPHIWLEWTFNPDSGNMDHDGLDWTAASGTQTYTPTEAGSFSAWIHATNNETGVRADKEAAYVRVGKPTVELKLEQASQNVYLGLENYGGGIGPDSIGVWGEKGRFYASFEGYQRLTKYLHGSPRWEVRRKDTGEEATNIGDWYNGRDGDTGFLTCELSEVPDQPGPVTYEISVSGGDGSILDTVEWTVNYISLSSAPAGLDYPETVDGLEIGDTVRINPGMLPAGAEIPGYPWSVYLFGEQMDQFATKDDAASTSTEKVYTVNRAGVYAATVLMTADGVTVGKEVIFRIKDGTGEVPKPEIQVGSWNGMERNIYIGTGLEPGYQKLFSDSFVDRLYFGNASVLKKELSGEPEWTVTENGSPAEEIGIRKDEYEAEIYLKSMPAAAGDRTYEITCSWDGLTWTGTYTVRFRAAVLPTKVRTDPEDGVVVIESGEYPPYDIHFDGWNQPEGEEAWQDMSPNLRTAVEEGKPGTYEGYMETGCANLVWREKMTVVINGPVTQLAVLGSTDVNVYVGMPGNGLLAEGGSVWQDSMIINLNVKPEDVLSHLDISPEPEWEIKQTGGKTLPITGGPKSWGYGARYLRYQLEEIPEEEGEAVFEVTCKWGSDVCVTEVKVHCIRIDWPTGLVNIDDTVDALVGETIVFEPEIAPAGWTVPGYGQKRWGFDDEVDEFADCEPTKDSMGQINDRHTLTFKKAGTFTSTYVIVSDRASVGREVTFHIREYPEWEFVLPEGTTEIGAYAFQNIAAKSVRISSRCKKIGEGAFDGSRAKYFYVPASVTEIGENAFPEGARLYTTAGSSAAAWAEGRPYRVIILGE